MIYFSFYRLDWLLINLLILLPLVILFSFVFIWRYFARWGKNNSRNLIYRKFNSENRLRLKYRQASKKIEANSSRKNIIVFAPALVRSRSFHYFITALGLYDCNVYTIKSRHLISYLSRRINQDYTKNKKELISDAFKELIDYFQVDFVITFDIMCGFMTNITDINSQISSVPAILHHIQIRPCDLHPSSHLIKLVPFTYRWWYVLFLISSGLPLKMNNILKKVQLNENIKSRVRNNLIILPKHSLLKKKQLEQNNEGKMICLDMGWFNFRFAETVALAHIMNAIEEID